MKSEVIHIRLDATTKKALVALAKKENRKLAALAAILIKKGLGVS